MIEKLYSDFLMLKKYRSLKKVYNYRKYEKAVYNKSIIDYVPPVLIISMTMNCNLRCPNCLYLNKDKDLLGHSGYFEFEMYKKLLKKYGKRFLYVFYTGGEPLLHKEIDKFIELSNFYKIKNNISTNGLLIDKNIEIMKKMNFINISIDATNADDYIIQRGGKKEKFHHLLNNLKLLKDNNINFSLSFLLSTHNIHKVSEMIEFSEKLGAELVSFHNYVEHSEYENDIFKTLTLQNREKIKYLKKVVSKKNYNINISLPYIFDETDLKLNKKCIQPWYYYVVNQNYTLAPCCHLAHDKKFGNIKDKITVNTKGMVKLRKDIIEKNFMFKDCIKCQRRFIGYETVFDKNKKDWVKNNIL